MGGEYLLCIQPSCDAVRLDAPTQFIFATLRPVRSELKFDIVVSDSSGRDICLVVDYRASNIRTYTFEPDADSCTVLSEVEGSVEFFRRHASKSARASDQFVWICDLKSAFAQRIVSRIANNLARIGLDEF